MANNKMLLTYRPTGESVLLGSRGGYGWESAKDLTEKIESLFEISEHKGASQDDFILTMESAENQPGCEDNFTFEEYRENGTAKLIFSDEVPLAKEDY